MSAKVCAKETCNEPCIPRGKYCKAHRTRTGKKCQEKYEDGNPCGKSARGTTDFCIEHGGGKRCQEKYEDGNPCGKSAIGTTDFCVEHGGGKRCPNCIDWIDSRCGSSKYDWYCATCFKVIFPSDPRSTIIYSHAKEIQVRNAISKRALFDNRFKDFIHDIPLYTGNCDCIHRRRVDHRKLIGNTILAIETDEFAHRSYDEKDEEIRYDDLYMIHSGKWIFIRFNQDNTRNIKIDMEDRLDVLMETMEEQMYRIEKEKNTEPLEIIKLFY